MTSGPVTRAQLLAERPWKPIRGCPGRLVLDGLSERSVEDLAGLTSPASARLSPMAPDPVLVVQLADGGLISYRKPDGRYLHTLATTEAFERKCRQLGFLAGLAGFFTTTNFANPGRTNVPVFFSSL